MRLAIVGSRGFDNYQLLKQTLQTLRELTPEDPVDCVISGGAAGADSLAEFWAREQGIPIQVIKPEWDVYGKSAGFMRNSNIVNNADHILAFWDGVSRGTRDTVEKAKQANKMVTVIRYIPRIPEIV